jgi:hypothetical protein
MSEKVAATAKTTEIKKGNSGSQGKKTERSETPQSPIDQILFLQRTVGNQAVQGLLKSGFIQAKLTIGQPGDVYEQEADRVAKQVMRMPLPSTAGRKRVSKYDEFPSIQRMCTDCEEVLQRQTYNSELDPLVLGHSAQEQLHRQPMEEEEELLQTKEVSDGTPEISPGVESQINRIRSGGQPLSQSMRDFFEPRFGQDFSRVRIHTDSNAGESANAVNALAYTVGQDIVFGGGQFAPGTHAGRRLLAHELTHVVQQAGGAPAIQRFVPCTRARMSLEECPHRESGEESASRREPMLVVYITSPEVGYLITNFDIGESKLKASAKRDPNWPTLINAITKAGSQWEILGLSDCHGEDALNILLRQQRADAVRAALPPAAAAHIVRSSGAPLYDCITDNENRIARQWNRAVLFRQVVTPIEFPEEVHEVKIPTEEPDTEDCVKSQRDALALAFPLAKKMVQAALDAIELEDEDLMRKYFGKDAFAHRFHIKQNFVAIKKGLNAGPTFECEEADSWLCEGSEAYVIGPFGENIHLCAQAFTKGVDFLARTIVHEAAHGFAWVFFPDELCAGGCPPSMDTTDAEDNADSYGEFAGDALAKSP